KARGGNCVGVYYRERRNYIRFEVSRRQVRIRVRPAGEGPAREPGEAPLNISRSGLLFEGDTPYTIGEEGSIVCQGSQAPARVTLRARMVRVEEIEGEPRRFEVGAAFLLEWDHQETQVTEFLRRGGLAAG